VRKRGDGVAILIAIGLMLLASPAGAAPLLPAEAYSWSIEFAEWGYLQNCSSAWRLDSPLQTKQGTNLWQSVAIPFNQPGDSAQDPYLENPHRGLDFTFSSTGTSVYAVAYGTILSVTRDASGYYSVTQDIDFENDGAMDGIKVEYRNLVLGRKSPQPGTWVTPSTFLGTAGRDRTGIPRLHVRLIGNARYKSDVAVSPTYPFYDGVTSWYDGNDTAFTGYHWYSHQDGDKVYLVAYGRNPGTGEIVAPSEVTIFHEKYYAGKSTTSWRESQMMQVVGDHPTYMFDFLGYRDANGQPYYTRDGQTVRYIYRVKFGSDPNVYQWAFSPPAYERPYENPNDWGYRDYYFMVHDLPRDPLVHYWFSQIDPSQDDARYSWDDYELNYLFYHNIYDPNDPDKDDTPFEWNPQEDIPPNGTEPGPYPNTSPGSGLMQQFGCNACSWAMVLKNLSEQGDYLRRDFRYEQTDYLKADPFDVTLASTQDFGQWWSIWDGKWYSEWVCTWDDPRGSSSPLALNYSNIVAEFGVSAKMRSFGRTRLGAAMTSAATVATVESTYGFPTNLPDNPADDFYITIYTDDDVAPEIMLVTAVSGTTLTVERGCLGTTPTAHNVHDGVYEGTDESKALAIYRQIVTTELPRQTRPQGIIVRIDGHYMVFTDTSLTETSFPNRVLFEDWALSGWTPISPAPLASGSLAAGARVADLAQEATASGADRRFSECPSFPGRRLFEVEQILVVGP